MKNAYLQFNSRDEFQRIDISKIVFFESEGNYTNIVTVNKLKSVVCMNLMNMQKLLSENLKSDAKIFARVGKKHIINHSYVFRISISKQELILSDGSSFAFKLSLSKNALKALKEIYASSSSREQ